MEISEELNQTFDPLDPAKTWPEDKFPLMPVGKMMLNRNPDNFFTEVEQAAFCSANLVPGIEFSDDKLLQGRIFSYVDTQRYRLGANFHELPTNRPLAPVVNNQRDGAMQFEMFKGRCQLQIEQRGRSTRWNAIQAVYPGEPNQEEDLQDR